jgi:hypothetical protein
VCMCSFISIVRFGGHVFCPPFPGCAGKARAGVRVHVFICILLVIVA